TLYGFIIMLKSFLICLTTLFCSYIYQIGENTACGHLSSCAWSFDDERSFFITFRCKRNDIIAARKRVKRVSLVHHFHSDRDFAGFQFTDVANYLVFLLGLVF